MTVTEVLSHYPPTSGTQERWTYAQLRTRQYDEGLGPVAELQSAGYALSVHLCEWQEGDRTRAACVVAQTATAATTETDVQVFPFATYAEEPAAFAAATFWALNKAAQSAEAEQVTT